MPKLCRTEKAWRTRSHRGAMLLAAAAALLAAACAAPESFGGSRQAATEWAEARGFSALELRPAGIFELAVGTRKPLAPAATLVVYIEGDGAAWPTPYHPPRDPTPRRPIALALAAADPAPAVAYLGRPCQYLEKDALTRCPSDYWVERRFAPEVIAAYDEIVTELKTRFGAQRLQLVGYSGGGTIAALLAARRGDVDRLITVAAPLAVTEWVQWHGATPLAGSLDPYDSAASMPDGVHFVGGDDKTVPAAIVARFVARKGGRMERIAGFDHECCWARDWKNLLRLTLVQEEMK